MELLRSNDMEAYLQMAQTSTVGKESRLKELLSSTDACLRQLSTRLATMPGRLRDASQAMQADEQLSSSGQQSCI